MATGTEDKDGVPKIKPRPIMRLGIFLIAHSLVFSIICLAAGILALLLLPTLAKNTYISENALMPGSARSMLSDQDIADGDNLVKRITETRLKSEGQGVEVERLIATYMSHLGAEVSYHHFQPEASHFHPLGFFSGPASRTTGQSFNCSSYGINVAGIIRAPRGDGKESIVLVTPYNYLSSGRDEALSLGIAYSVFSLLTRVTWLSKDIIWLVADSRHGDYAPVSAWLKDYYTPSFHSSESGMCKEPKTVGSFRRAGTMAAALVLKVGDGSELFEDSVTIYAEASNGQMPNLDLINVVNYLAAHRRSLHVKVDKVASLFASNWLKVIGDAFEAIGKIARSINADWDFGIPSQEYTEGAATLASSLYYQALGIPTGPHGAFREYQVDAITLKMSPRVSSHNFAVRNGRLIEGTIRSVNNLLEKFHQSFFLYLLTSPSKFVSVGVYMIPFALLIAPLPMAAASLYMGFNNPNKNPSRKINFESWKWLNAAKQVFAAHLWGATVSLLPYFINQIPNHTPAGLFSIWGASSLLILLFFTISSSPFSRPHESQLRDWAILKAVTISAVFTGLCLMSIINFATAELGALLIVPMCLMARPLKLDLKSRTLTSLLRMICNLILVLLGFPAVIIFLSKGLIGGFENVCVGDVWNWIESLWAWNSATYLYIGMIHLPCWALFVGILTHSC